MEEYTTVSRYNPDMMASGGAAAEGRDQALIPLADLVVHPANALLPGLSLFHRHPGAPAGSPARASAVTYYVVADPGSPVGMNLVKQVCTYL